mgnify:CR=1 FL=1
MTLNDNHEDMEKFSGKAGGSTFLIRIYFKQHANWQGTIQWLETNKTVPFRSVLELISLLNEAVDKNFPANEGLDFRSWENLSTEEIVGSDYTDN